MVDCPICSKPVKSANINQHIDSECQAFIENQSPESGQQDDALSVSSFFQRPAANQANVNATPKANASISTAISQPTPRKTADGSVARNKRVVESTTPSHMLDLNTVDVIGGAPALKKPKTANPFQKELPLATRMRPQILDDICGQELVGPKGVLREIVKHGRIPSMVLWGDPGTGKTTIARVIASMVKGRFIEINSTNFGVGECKKFFSEVYADFKPMLGAVYSKNTYVLVGQERAKAVRSEDNHIL
jgi:putative ATPase